MNTTHTLALLLAAACAVHTYGGDAKVTLDSADGSSAFVVRDAASNALARVQSDGKVGIGIAAPAYKLDVAGSLNATGITIGGVPVASSTDTYWSTNASAAGSIQYSGGNIGVGTATPAASAQLDVSATDKGMLVPRLTQTQRDAVASPATGLLVYQTDNNPGFYFYDGAQWSSISAGAGAVTDVSATAPLASSGGTTPTLSMPAATSSANGYLMSADWTTFNNKVATTRTISTTAPLTGGGALSGNLTLAMPVATASVNGYLSSTDWTTFNNKVSAGANSTITSLTGLTTDLSVAQGGTGASTLTGYVIGNGTSAMTASATIPGSAISGNISGTATKASNLVGGNSTTLLGAIGYQSNTDTTTLLAPNTTTTKKFLRMTGTGSNGAAPVWDTAAAAGANSDITSLSGLTTDITVAQGGTGASTASAARTNLGAAAAGANSDITSLGGLTTALSVAQGGTGASTLTANKVLVGNGASTPLQPTNLHWDNTNSRLGIGDTTPSYTVDVAGDVNVTGSFLVNGSAVAATPAGAVMQFAGAAAPTGYLLCQGQAVSRTTYAALYAVITTTYGAGDGSTTFNVPNLMGNVPVGRKSTDTSFDVLGETGGAKTHTLSVTEMPSHTHSEKYYNPTYAKVVGDGDGTINTSPTSSSTTTGSAGSGDAHNNLQPYIVINYIIKY